MTTYTLRKPALKPIPERRRAADRDCPDAGWKRLTNAQKSRLSILARKAYAHQRVQGIPLDEWRHEVSISACGLRISEATQRHWADLKSAFQDLAGEHAQAFKTQLRDGDNKRRIALHKLTQECQAKGLDIAYAERICVAQFKIPLAEASAKQLWCLYFTITKRGKTS